MASIFFVLVAFLTAEPLISTQGMLSGKPAKKCCAKMMKCHKGDLPQDSNKKCTDTGCNPFMACSYGNFFLAPESNLNFSYQTTEKKRQTLINDNRLSSGLSE